MTEGKQGSRLDCFVWDLLTLPRLTTTTTTLPTGVYFPDAVALKVSPRTLFVLAQTMHSAHRLMYYNITYSHMEAWGDMKKQRYCDLRYYLYNQNIYYPGSEHLPKNTVEKICF